MHKLTSRAFLPLVVSVIALGAAQSVLKALMPQVVAVTLLDDIALVLACVSLAIGRAKTVPLPAWASVFVWALLLAISAARTVVDPGTTLEIVRQLAVPAALIVVGFALTRTEWRTVMKASLVVGVLNGIYAVIEIMFGRLINPAVMASHGRLRDGVPPSYFWWDAAGDIHSRAGGLALNPPVAGIIIGGALVLGWILAKHWWQYALALTLTVPLYLTYSRAGMVIAAAGVLIPLLVRYLGIVVTAVLATAGASAAFIYFSGHGASLRHVSGLTNAVRGLAEAPLGAPVGTYGNFAARTTDTRGSESLIGLGIATTGIIGFLLIVALVVLLLRMLLLKRTSVAGLALGLLAAALVSESVSALNGTVALWVACGIALQHTDIRERARLWPRLASHHPGRHVP